jgi:hypothetical protein
LTLIAFVKIGTPVYRLERKNLEVLLRLVVEGEATDNDWEVFLGVPIRHNDQLEAIRLHCRDISEREYLGIPGRLLTDKGIEEVKVLLNELTGADK